MNCPSTEKKYWLFLKTNMIGIDTQHLANSQHGIAKTTLINIGKTQKHFTLYSGQILSHIGCTYPINHSNYDKDYRVFQNNVNK